MKFAQLSGQALRFAGVGGIASALYFVVAALLNGVFGLATVAASVIAYAIAATFAYQGHKRLTFASGTAGRTEVTRFIAATAVGLGLALVIPILLRGYAPMVSFLSVLVIVPICSFLMMKFFVFRA